MRSSFLVGAALVAGCGLSVPGFESGLGDPDGGSIDGGLEDSGTVDAGIDCNAGHTPSAELVFTERGPVRGQVSANGRAFRGLPFVKPPLGALRWRPPERELTCWAAPRDATQFGAKCPQLDQKQGTPFDAGAAVEGSEDCLTLNVFTPASASPDAGLPVMFFIHGGGNTNGSASESFEANGALLYDGTTLAQRGDVVVVTTQYRVGALGFLTLPALDGESDAGVSGNYGLLDQQAALQWVQRNIRSFGGDPDRVLLFGESAGAVNTCTQLAMPSSAGLFHRAIVQSGACRAVPAVDVRRTEGTTWLGGTGCAGAVDVPACLRQLSPEQLIRAYPVPVVVGGRKPPVSWGPTLDGLLIPREPAEAMRLGLHHRVPLIIGSNADETGLVTPAITTEAEYRAALTALTGPNVALRVLQQYPVAAYGTPRRALVQVTTDASFTCQARLASRAAAIGQPGVPVRRYLFTHALQPARGAFHGLELFYLFQKLGEVAPQAPASEFALEASLLGFWTRFAATGDPNLPGASEWPLLTSTEPLQVLDTTLSTQAGYRNAECDFWDSLSAQGTIPPPP